MHAFRWVDSEEEVAEFLDVLEARECKLVAVVPYMFGVDISELVGGKVADGAYVSQLTVFFWAPDNATANDLTNMKLHNESS